jgi:hypothetical protein
MTIVHAILDDLLPGMTTLAATTALGLLGRCRDDRNRTCRPVTPLEPHKGPAARDAATIVIDMLIKWFA